MALVALVLGVIVIVWALLEQSWPLGLLALAVVFLAIAPAGSIHLG